MVEKVPSGTSIGNGNEALNIRRACSCRNLFRRRLRNAFIFTLLLLLLRSLFWTATANETRESPRVFENNSESETDRRAIGSRLQHIVKSAALLDDPLLSQWKQSEQRSCNGRFKGYANAFALLEDVVLDPSLAVSKRRGGEDPKEVEGRPDSEEEVDFQRGFLRMRCNQTDKAGYAISSHIHKMKSGVFDRIVQSMQSTWPSGNSLRTVQTPTLLVYRHEFLNVYHTATEWHAAFTQLVFFGLDPNDVQILLVDVYPQGQLDATWSTLFRRVLRLHELPGRVRFEKLIFAMTRLNNPVYYMATARAPFLEEFRAYVFTAHGLLKQLKRPLAMDMRATVILRKAYEARRSSDGTPMTRMFANEEEILSYLLDDFSVQEDNSTFRISSARGVVLGDLPFKQQLRIMAETDVLIGMHGAGMVLALFVPRKAAVIEILPRYLPSQIFAYFTCIYKWRELRYVQFHSQSLLDERFGYRTRVSEATMRKLFRAAMLNDTSAATALASVNFHRSLLFIPSVLLCAFYLYFVR